MAIVVTATSVSIAEVLFAYKITGLVNGANAISLPTPPAKGSFPVAGDWTPTTVLCFPYNTGAVGTVVTPDLTTIANTAGAVTFTLYATGATNVLCFVF